jgi:hypothetical protein
LEGRILLLTKTQRRIIWIWVGAPFVAFLLLTAINPGYELLLITNPLCGNPMILMTLILQFLNWLTLNFGLRHFNRVEGEAESSSRKTNAIYARRFIIVVTFIFFTLPSLFVVLIGPSILVVMHTGTF